MRGRKVVLKGEELGYKGVYGVLRESIGDEIFEIELRVESDC